MTLAPPHDDSPSWGVGWVLVGAAFALGFIGFPLQVLGHRAEYLPGNDIDNPLNNYILEHGFRYLTGQDSTFWDAPMFYPQLFVTGSSDAHIGMLPIYSIFRFCGFLPERAFQGHFLASFVLNFAAAVWALRRLGFGVWGTAAGAYLFTFALPLVAQLNHTQLFPRFLVPPAVVFAWEILRAPRTFRLTALAACVVGQAYLSVYVAYFLVLLLATGFVLVAILFRQQLPWRELLSPGRGKWKQRLWVLTGAVLASLPLVIGHVRGGGSAPGAVVHGLAPQPEAWVTTSAVAAPGGQAGALRSQSAVGETQLAPGILTLAALAFGLGRLRQPGPIGGTYAAIAVASLATALLVLLVSRFGPVWLYSPLAYCPGVSGMRVVGRIVLVLLFPAGIALAGGVDACVRQATRTGRLLAVPVGVICLGGVIANHWLSSPRGEQAKYWAEIRYPLEHILARQELLAQAIRGHPAPKFVYVFPSAADSKPLGSLVIQLEAMRTSQNLGLPCVNGWSGYLPSGWKEFNTYRELMEWLTIRNQIPEDQLVGLVIVGEPAPDPDPNYEAAMRATFPPRSVHPRP